MDVKWLKDASGTKFYPKTHEEAVIDDNGTNLETKLSDIDSGKEDKTNKVTSISSSSTDTQYPSAKCVYDAIQAGGGGSGIPYLYIVENSGEVSIDYGDTTYETYEEFLDLCTILQETNTDLCAIYFRNRIILGSITVSYNGTVKSIVIQSVEGDNFSISSDTPSNPDPGDSLVATVTKLVASNAELEDALGDIDSVLDEILGDVDGALDNVLGENATPMQEKIVIETVSGNALSAYPGKYYKFSTAVETLDITLNHSFNNNTIETIVFNMTGGTTPNVMFDSATGESIYYSAGFTIESGKTYEISALWNGSNWLIANINLSAQTS